MKRDSDSHRRTPGVGVPGKEEQPASFTSEMSETLRTALKALPRRQEPSRDLWPGIASRLETSAHRKRGRPWFPRLAAAVLLIGIGWGLALWTRPATDSTVLVQRGEQADLEAQYKRARHDFLTGGLDLPEDLSPLTLKIVERNLRIIDEAIDELRKALEDEPGNPQLETMIEAKRRRGLALLHDVESLEI